MKKHVGRVFITCSLVIVIGLVLAGIGHWDAPHDASHPQMTASQRMQNHGAKFGEAGSVHGFVTCQPPRLQSVNGYRTVECDVAGTLQPGVGSRLPFVFSPLLLITLCACLVSWLATKLMLHYEHLHAHLSCDHVGSGPQKDHAEPVSRIGGLAVAAGLLTALVVMRPVGMAFAQQQFGLLLLAGIPAFLGGLLEDLTKKVGVFERFILTMMSGALAVLLGGVMITHLDLPVVDQALLWLPFAVVFTSFAVGGVTNAINIIDGINGLALGYAAIALGALAYVAFLVGDGLVLQAALAIIGAVLGLFFWNWPGGKIFLGDGGAYLLGFLLAELSVLLVERNPDVSPWFPLLVLSYPIFETLYSMYRRKVRHRCSPGQPDNRHMHQLIRDAVIPLCRPDGKTFTRLERNSCTAKYFWITGGALALLGVWGWRSTPLLFFSALAYCVLYMILYERIWSSSELAGNSLQSGESSFRD